MIQLDEVVIKGFMPFVGEYHIPLAKQGLVFVVGENRISKMADSNGSGKTALFDAISWACYDRILRGTGGDRVVNTHSKYAHVEVKFSINDKQFVVVRQQGQKRIWELFDGVETLGNGDDVARLFGLSYRAFTQTILFGVSNLDSFAQQSDTPRKQLFDDLLDTAFFGEKKKRIETESKQVVEKLELAQLELAEVMASLQTLETEQTSIGTKRDEAESSALKHWLDGHSDRVQLYDDVNQTMAKYLAALTHVEAEQALVDDSNALAALRNRIQSLFSRSTQRMFKIKREMEAIVHGDRCEMCRRPLDAETRKEVEHYFMDEISPLREECEILVRYEVALEHALATWPRISRDENADLMRHKLESLHTQLERQQLPTLLDEARYLRQASDEIDERRGALQAKQGKLQKMLDEYQAAMTLREFWIEGFGHRGIKAMLLADYEVFINERLSRYSQTLTAGELSLTFSASKTLKSGSVRDEIQFTAVNIHGAEVYDDLSSGEKQRVDLCLVLALQDLVRELHRGRFGLALYDEIFEHFDETGCEQVMDFLTTQRREFGSLFVISQNPKLLSYPSDKIIRVIKTQKGSVIDAT